MSVVWFIVTICEEKKRELLHAFGAGDDLHITYMQSFQHDLTTLLHRIIVAGGFGPRRILMIV